MPKDEEMKTPPTLGQVLGILSVIIIPLLVWGISVETRLTETFLKTEQNTIQNVKIEQKIDKIGQEVKEINESTIKILAKLED